MKDYEGLPLLICFLLINHWNHMKNDLILIDIQVLMWKEKKVSKQLVLVR
jgi:hypothetical protein